jgi:hypothetical protein
MTLYNYIWLDGKRYKTNANNWSPEGMSPGDVRLLANGQLDSTYAPATYRIWTGEIIADNTPEQAPLGYEWGTPANLRASLSKRTALEFTDNFGDNYTVHVRQWKERYLGPKWDEPTGHVYMNVTLMGVPA